MIRSLWTASTGMEAQQLKMDIISNNLANVNTAGFKRSRASFQDLLYQQMKTPGTSATAGNMVPSGIQIGHGSRTAAVQRMFEVGSFQQTNRNLDCAIEGKGFYQVTLPSGEPSYTRDGSFNLDSEGNLVTSNGYLFEPQITVPADAGDIVIGTDGIVTITRDDQAAAEEIGQIQIAKFANPSGLKSLGYNLYQATDASGEPIVGNPGEEGLGKLSQSYLEMSNVNLVEEMVNLISTERAYEFNSKILKAADDMLRTAARSIG